MTDAEERLRNASGGGYTQYTYDDIAVVLASLQEAREALEIMVEASIHVLSQDSVQARQWLRDKCDEQR